jgi:hypothetical protein
MGVTPATSTSNEDDPVLKLEAPTISNGAGMFEDQGTLGLSPRSLAYTVSGLRG